MKKKIIYATLVVFCISFFSFREAGQCNAGTTLKNCPEKIIPVLMVEEADFSPLCNLLKI